MDNTRMMRIAGILAVFGGVINGFADYLLQGGLILGPAVNTYENLANVDYDLVFWGTIIGNAAIPLWLLGFWPVYVALAPAGRWFALPTVILLGYGFSLFAGYHGSYALYAAGFQAEVATQPAISDATSTLVTRLNEYHGALLVLIGLTVPLGSLLFILVVLFRRTHYARWMIVCSPFVAFLTQGWIETLPAPWGGVIRPAWSTTIFTLFFLLATIVTWNVKPNQSSSD
ncbi:MAG: DUF6796 family protein [Pseudomonadota bacterium]